MEAVSATSRSPTLRLALTIGYIGGLTTYSSFSLTRDYSLQDGAPDVAAVNVIVTLFGCFAAGWLGLIASNSDPSRGRHVNS